MALEAVIFDLDLTLIASGAAEELRRRRDWRNVYQMIPTLAPYEGVGDLIVRLREQQVKTAIVTSSPGSYCRRVINHWGWAIDATVCYHDTSLRKPHPDPIIKALDKLGVAANKAIAIGDEPGDIISAKAAGVLSAAALWGTADIALLLAERPDQMFKTVSDFATFLKSRI